MTREEELIQDRKAFRERAKECKPEHKVYYLNQIKRCNAQLNKLRVQQAKAKKKEDEKQTNS